MHTVFLSLGSNIGNRLHFLRQAVQALQENVLTEFTSSIVLETPALLLPDSPSEWDRPYCNLVVRGKTHSEPEALLSALKAIEDQCGRSSQHLRWSPRTLDIDILLYDSVCIQTERLTIPHSELKHRDFLLHLLALLEPELVCPGTQETFDALARAALQKTKTKWKHAYVLFPQCMGIVNVTPDSFSDGGCYYQPDAAVAHCQQLWEEGASLLDLGAQSTRPDLTHTVTWEEEWSRLQPVLERLDPSIPVSVDTYYADLVEQLLSQGKISWINDVSGRLPEKTLQHIADAGCAICTMHSLSVPPKTGEYVTSLLPTLAEWGERQVEMLTRCGFPLDRIVLDPGVGFGKTAYQTGVLLKTIDQWKRLGVSTLLGHSRKSFYAALGAYGARDRDHETVAISLLLKNKIDYIRVHNVAWHQRALVAQQMVENCYASSGHFDGSRGTSARSLSMD